MPLASTTFLKASLRVDPETPESLGLKMFHIMDNQTVSFKNPIPAAGPHRPMWAAYGTYNWCPPGRYMHNLEHGALLFLYHPCTDNKLVTKFKNLARNCLWRHIISKWEDGFYPLNDYQLAIVAWRHIFYIRDLENSQDRLNAVNFIKKYAEVGNNNEGTCWGNGGFTNGLVEKSELVTDVLDREICPGNLDDIFDSAEKKHRSKTKEQLKFSSNHGIIIDFLIVVVIFVSFITYFKQ